MATTLLFGPINESRELPYEPAPNPAIKYSGLSASLPYDTTHLVASLSTWSTFWFALLCIFIVLNHKNMPFMWHVSSFSFLVERVEMASGLTRFADADS